jgi:Holliday junction resolvase
MPKSSKGSRRERELLVHLVSQGFVVHRVAGSGLGEDAICDLVAVRNGEIQFVECKSRKKTYYTKSNAEQLSRLIEISNSCKAKPVLAVKLNYKEWKIFDLNKGIPQKVE